MGVNSHLCRVHHERIGELDACQHVPHLGDDGGDAAVRPVDVQPHAFPRA
jgi:hypothetical protein